MCSGCDLPPLLLEKCGLVWRIHQVAGKTECGARPRAFNSGVSRTGGQFRAGERTPDADDDNRRPCGPCQQDGFGIAASFWSVHWLAFRALTTSSNSFRACEPRAALACPGKSQEARGLLAPVYGWFAEGLETLECRPKPCSTNWLRRRQRS